MRPLAKTLVILALACRPGCLVFAHEWHRHGSAESTTLAIPASEGAAPTNSEAVAERAASIAPFFPKARYFWDDDFFYIESDGIPDHDMMTGITAWQQQLPVPQNYFGANAWRIPLYPQKTEQTASAATTLFRGAIAIAINGIPIFNPIKNNGVTDTFLAGELDQWGGHCGRADDYHYHITPWHLQEIVGDTAPLAYALDGFPVYGDKETDGTAVDYGALDDFNGHEHDGAYHYHGSHTYPYLNGGVYLNPPFVTIEAGTGGNTAEQIEPQPRADGVRQALTGLSGVTITGFERSSEDGYTVSYTRAGNSYSVNVINDRAAGTVTYAYDDPLYGTQSSPEFYSGWTVPPGTAPTEIMVGRAAGGNLAFTVAGEPGRGYPFYVSDDLVDWRLFGFRRLDDFGRTSFELELVGVRGFLSSASTGGLTGPGSIIEPEPGGSVSQGSATTEIANLFERPGSRIAAVGTITAEDGTVWTVPAANNYTTAPKASDLYNQASGVTPASLSEVDLSAVPVVEVDPDGEVITGYLFADNYFELYINGTLVGVDPVPFTPFNSCVVRFRAKAPVTYAVKLIDWEENLGFGTELNGGNPYHAGDGGFMAQFSDGTVTDGNWKAQTFYIAPVDDPANVIELPDGTRDSSAVPLTAGSANNYAIHFPVPDGWSMPGFDDSEWPQATTFSEETVGVDNKPAYTNFADQFGGSGASFIWASSLVFDNEVIVRFTSSGTGTNPANWSMLALPDTGQTDGFTATFGEDHDYTSNPPSYTDNGNGTITDDVTGLMWQQGDGGEMTWESAASYCDALTLGGHGDWRLPTAHELFSIAHLNRRNPPLDAVFDSPSTANYWWASDERAGNLDNAWCTNRGGGIGPKPKSETASAGGTQNYHVRAVRDTTPPTGASATGPQLTVNGDGTATDANTGLVWQQGEGGAMTWEQALAYAESLSLGGEDDWRLPNIKELFSLVDFARSSPAIDTAIFPGVSAVRDENLYWSSTSNFARPGEPWYVDFRFGLTTFRAATNLYNVRCVRGGFSTP